MEALIPPPEAASTAPDFDAHLDHRGLPRLRRGHVKTLQLNIGRRCDLACHHCHVEAGPKRTEAMDRRGAERVLALLEASPQIEWLDITGGAPELNENFRFLVTEARRLGKRVLDRCNLTVLHLPGQEDTAEFLSEHQVGIAASLPCYTRGNVEKQRGRGVFGKSIDSLQRLNALGYGKAGSPLVLDLVYNPAGPFLPPDQRELEARYRQELHELFGLDFHHLLTIANMPIKRFAHALHRTGAFDAYLGLLVNHFNAETLPGLMCHSLVSVAYDGTLFDCDFNQALEQPILGPARTIWDVDDLGQLAGAAITTGPHCFGCTAGAGSSCGGALA